MSTPSVPGVGKPLACLIGKSYGDRMIPFDWMQGHSPRWHSHSVEVDREQQSDWEGRIKVDCGTYPICCEWIPEDTQVSAAVRLILRLRDGMFHYFLGRSFNTWVLMIDLHRQSVPFCLALAPSHVWNDSGGRCLLILEDVDLSRMVTCLQMVKMGTSTS